MGRNWKLLLIILYCFSLSGCKKALSPEPAQLNLVQQIDISYYKEGVHLQRHYTDADKMDTVLFYLYSLSPLGRAEEDPEHIAADSCKITLAMTNGETRIYRQRGGRYLSVDCKPWQKIDPDKADDLFPLLARMCSDEI